MNYYFIGIGGIGMSALARYCKTKGYEVSGYDRTESELTRKLESEGINVHYCEDINYIPKDINSTTVVYTPAIPADMAELVYVKENGYKLVKRSQMLGELTRNENCLAVAGTHGKTTTSTMIAHILYESKGKCSAFLGGISKNYNTNMLVCPQSNSVVVEADEFDRSFLQLRPLISVITAIDADHLDIYGTYENVKQAFHQYASQVTEAIILKYGVELDRHELSAKVLSYHTNNENADFHAINIRLDDEGYNHYDLVYPAGVLKDIKLGVIGKVNIENSIAAAAAALSYGIDAQVVREALGTFCGVKRRLDMHLNSAKCTYIDDYAHHPVELEAAITSIRESFPGRKITGIFQPHLYSRTKDFYTEFAKSLSLLDEVILLDIYPAREDPIDGVSSELIFDLINVENKVLIRKEELMSYLSEKKFDVLVTLGAGDIDRFINPITALLNE